MEEHAPDLDPDAASLLARARSGTAPPATRLHLGRLEVGQVGVVEAEVRAVGVVRAYNRKRGGQGLLVRVTLADATGDADLVLWDDEVRQAQDGPFTPGGQVRLHGPVVKAGRGGGVELGLGGAEVVAIRASQEPVRTLQGLLLEIGETFPIGAPPALRFKADLLVQTRTGPVRVVAWDAAVKAALAAGLGAVIEVQGTPNPLLDGWWTAQEIAQVRRTPSSATPK